MTAVVSDTHPLLFHAAGGGRLGRRAAKIFAAAEERQAIVYVPAVVMWEVSLLARVGRITLGRSVRKFFDDLFSNPAFQPLDLTPEHVLLADERRPNTDPFDGLICAVARALDLPLLTRDANVTEAGLVRTVW